MLTNSSIDTLTGLSLSGLWNGTKTLVGALAFDFGLYADIMAPVVKFAEGVVRLLKLLP